MARPKPYIILENIDRITHKTDQILKADAIWAVYYKNDAFNLRTKSNHALPKYKKTSFSNKGHAINLAKKLNEQFDCNDFQVYKLTNGTIV